MDNVWTRSSWKLILVHGLQNTRFNWLLREQQFLVTRRDHLHLQSQLHPQSQHQSHAANIYLPLMLRAISLKQEWHKALVFPGNSRTPPLGFWHSLRQIQQWMWPQTLPTAQISCMQARYGQDGEATWDFGLLLKQCPIYRNKAVQVLHLLQAFLSI